MARQQRRVRRVRSGVLAAACATWAAFAGGQEVTEPALKAAYIFNVAKLTEWPPDVLPATGRFVACVYGDKPVGDALERTLKGRLLSGRATTLVRVVLAGPLRSCHLLYVSGVTVPQLREALAIVQGRPVLTISDADELASAGSIVQIFDEHGTIRFDLNVALATYARLLLSPKLLLLANRVHDVPAGVTR